MSRRQSVSPNEVLKRFCQRLVACDMDIFGLRGKKPAQDEARWITVHPGGKGPKKDGSGDKGGTPVLIDDETGRIMGGMGGKFAGQKINEIKKDFVGPKSPTDEQKASANQKTQTGSSLSGHISKINELGAQRNTETIYKLMDEGKWKTSNDILMDNSVPQEIKDALLSLYKTNTAKADKDVLEFTYGVNMLMQDKNVMGEWKKSIEKAEIAKFGTLIDGVHNAMNDVKSTKPNKIIDEYFYANAPAMLKMEADLYLQKADDAFFSDKKAYNKFMGLRYRLQRAFYKMSGQQDKVDSLAKDMSKKITDNINNSYENKLGKIDTQARIQKAKDSLSATTLGNVSRGKPMTHEEADNGAVNPGYGNTDESYHKNCQTCVIAYEARIRGFNIEALPKTTEAQERLAHNAMLGWIDPNTGGIPKIIMPENLDKMNETKYVGFLRNELKEGNRYFMRNDWRGKEYSHIVTISKTSDGVTIYDPQSNKTYSERGNAGHLGLHEYFKDVPFKKCYKGTTLSKGCPYIFRVDDMAMDMDFVSKILVAHN